MTITEIITSVLGGLVEGRIWQSATPDDLPRDSNDRIKPFLLWTIVGGQDSEYVGQVMGSHSNARVQIHAVSPAGIGADTLIKQARDTLLASEYTVGVYGSPVGTYDAARKLQGRFQQFSVWFPQ